MRCNTLKDMQRASVRSDWFFNYGLSEVEPIEMV